MRNVCSNNDHATLRMSFVDKAPYGVDRRLRVHCIRMKSLCFFVTFLPSGIVVSPSKLFLWIETMIDHTLNSSSTGVV